MATDEGTLLGPANEGRYIFDNAAEPARIRVDNLAQVYDASTIEHLKARGVGKSWSCLEVGAGGGSIAAWLARQVGPTGYVLATDIDTRFIAYLAQPHLEVRRHNIVTDALPENTFDLIHTRLVLHHLPEHERALQRIVKALKPGGWAVIEEFDTRSLSADASLDGPELVWKTYEVMLQLMARQGVDLGYGRRLPGYLHTHGLTEIGAQGSFSLWRGKTAHAQIIRANYEQLRTAILESGLITQEDFKQDLARLDDPKSILLSPVMWTVWGRRPPHQDLQ